MDALQSQLNVLMSFQLPFALIPVLYITMRQDVMGSYRTKRFFKAVVVIVSTALLIINLATAVSAVKGAAHSGAAKAFAGMALAIYGLFVVYLLIGPKAIHGLLKRWDSAKAWQMFGWLAQEGVVKSAPLLSRCCPGGSHAVGDVVQPDAQ